MLILFPPLVLDWRMTDANHPMNALMRLNQIHPGLQYRLLSQSGPVHAPVFTMSVEIQGTTYQATGNSKRTAKLQVALKVFAELKLGMYQHKYRYYHYVLLPCSTTLRQFYFKISDDKKKQTASSASVLCVCEGEGRLWNIFILKEVFFPKKLRTTVLHCVQCWNSQLHRSNGSDVIVSIVSSVHYFAHLSQSERRSKKDTSV